MREELEALDDADHDLGVLRERMAGVGQELGEAAEKLSGLRRAAAAGLSEAVAAVLPKLGLPGASFEVRLTTHEMVSAGGAESVEFLVATNRGFDAMPLARIASGGELSRVMLRAQVDPRRRGPRPGAGVRRDRCRDRGRRGRRGGP